MAITSTDIENQGFSNDFRGYNVDEVDEFLERVASEVDEMNSKIIDLESQLAEAKAQANHVSPSDATTIVTSYDSTEKDARIAQLERELEERRADDNVIAQALITAQRSGDEIVAKAKQSAVTIQRDAEEEARRILEKASNEKQRILDNITALQDDREKIRAEYSDLLTDFISHATKKLTEIGPTTKSGHSTSMTTFSSFSESSPEQSSARLEAERLDAMTATYTTPQMNLGSVVPAAPRPSVAEKDLSGFGDAMDDFEFNDLD